MSTAVCTLFEGHYHYGVAALSNSLYQQGFRGHIYIGYRGKLPKWTTPAIENDNLGWSNAKTLQFNNELILHFLPLLTDYSLTNYKPDFMLSLLNNANLNIDNIFYFDPDITINKHWNHFKQWIEAGVALCEDVNSPMPEYHPRRVGWRNYYASHDVSLKFKSDFYVNGGFIGLKKSDIEFLKTWQLVQELMALKIGSLERSIFSNDAAELKKTPGFNYFDKTDQDALNVAVEATNLNVSVIAKEAMGFLLGDTLMYHNLGFSKPWRKNYTARFLKGIKPGYGDLQFWESLNNKPILPFSKFVVQRKLLLIKLYRFLSRFYSAK